MYESPVKTRGKVIENKTPMVNAKNTAMKKPFGQSLQVQEAITVKKNEKKPEEVKVTPKVEKVQKIGSANTNVNITTAPKVEKVQRIGNVNPSTANKTSAPNIYNIQNRNNNTPSSYSINRIK
mgnify:CR=1 FL=1|jgi:mRNA-degrading endonuclease toxin of MazEF toxin-antitoxin module